MTERDRPQSDEAMRFLARALAPYLLDEFRALIAAPDEEVNSSYDDATCGAFVAGLGDDVLPRATVLFSLLASHRFIDSVTLADAIGVAPRAISGHLTTPLKRRARTLQLPLPFLGGEGSRANSGLPAPLPGMVEGRTHWQDHDGIADRMLQAIEDEQTERRRNATESLTYGGRQIHVPNRDLTAEATKLYASGSDAEITVYANTFQGYTVFGDQELRDLSGTAYERWEARRELPKSLTLLRAVLFADARAERMTDYGASAWIEHKAYMRLLAGRIAARVAAGETEDEYLTAVRWLQTPDPGTRGKWERVPDRELRIAIAAVDSKADMVMSPSTLAANRKLAEPDETERTAADD